MYIRSASAISPQLSFQQMLDAPEGYTGDRLRCVEPDYTAMIDPKMIRRMSRIIKMGVAAAKDCLGKAGVEQPDAIITGTAYGCLADTEAFLSRMIGFKEELLNPTSFIQSTHNTVAAQIALLLKCHQYNNTYVHRGFSFENALLDAVTRLREGEGENALVGGVDEITDSSHRLLSRFGLYRANASTATLYETGEKGTMNGEGAVFLLLSANASSGDYARLEGMHTFYKPATGEEVQKEMAGFLKNNNIAAEDIDLMICGDNGDTKNDKIYQQVRNESFAGVPYLRFKHYCGEYPTAGAFALWLGSHILKTGQLPADAEKLPAPPRKVLVHNHSLNIHHSLFLLSVC